MPLEAAPISFMAKLYTSAAQLTARGDTSAETGQQVGGQLRNSEQTAAWFCVVFLLQLLPHLFCKRLLC